MASVRRNTNGEITHVLVNGRFYTKEDASKIMYGDIAQEELLDYARISARPIQTILFEVINERENVYQTKAKILSRLGKIGEPDPA